MNEITYTILTPELCQPVVDLIHTCFPTVEPKDQHDLEDLQEAAEIFPEGTIIALDGDKVIGMGMGCFLNVDFENLPDLEIDLLYTFDESNHDPDGNYYYGSDLAVHPDYRGQGIAREIYNRRKAVVVDNNKKGFAAAAVLPGYANHKQVMDIHTYVDQVIAGKLFDPTLSVQLRNSFRVVGLKHDFYNFPLSDNWCALILWFRIHSLCEMCPY